MSEARTTTECCYLDEDKDIFMRELNGNKYRYYPKQNFRNHVMASQHIGEKPGMDSRRVAAMCRLAFNVTTLEDEGLSHEDVYRTLEELGQR